MFAALAQHDLEVRMLVRSEYIICVTLTFGLISTNEEVEREFER